MKLSPLVFPLIGLMIGLIAVGYGLTYHYFPNMRSAQNLVENNEALQTEIAKEPTIQNNIVAAADDLETIQARWQSITARRTPPQSVEQGGIDLSVNRYQLTVDAEKFRDSVQRAVNRQVKVGGVTVDQGPAIPAPPTEAENIVQTYFNYPGLSFPAAFFDLGPITVRGTYKQITDNHRAWSQMPGYLATASGLTLQQYRPDASPPELVGTYNVSVVALLRGETVAAPVPSGGGGGGGAGFAAGFGGFGGGF